MQIIAKKSQSIIRLENGETRLIIPTEIRSNFQLDGKHMFTYSEDAEKIIIEIEKKKVV